MFKKQKNSRWGEKAIFEQFMNIQTEKNKKYRNYGKYQNIENASFISVYCSALINDII